MAIAFRSASTAGNSTLASVTVTTPSGAAAGDVLVAWIYWDEPQTMPTPSGWTLEQSELETGTTPDYRFAMYTLPLTGSPAANYTWTPSASTWLTAAMVALSGAKTTGDVTDGSSSANGGGPNVTTYTVAGITTTTNGDMLLVAALNYNGGSYSAGSAPATTERVDFAGIGVYSGVQATAGATGTMSITSSSSENTWVAQLVAVFEASGAAATSLPPQAPARRWQHLLAQ